MMNRFDYFEDLFFAVLNHSVVEEPHIRYFELEQSYFDINQIRLMTMLCNIFEYRLTVEREHFYKIRVTI